MLLKFCLSWVGLFRRNKWISVDPRICEQGHTIFYLVPILWKQTTAVEIWCINVWAEGINSGARLLIGQTGGRAFLVLFCLCINELCKVIRPINFSICYHLMFYVAQQTVSDAAVWYLNRRWVVVCFNSPCFGCTFFFYPSMLLLLTLHCLLYCSIDSINLIHELYLTIQWSTNVMKCVNIKHVARDKPVHRN